jgi:hypothetical protein
MYKNAALLDLFLHNVVEFIEELTNVFPLVVEKWINDVF